MCNETFSLFLAFNIFIVMIHPCKRPHCNVLLSVQHNCSKTTKRTDHKVLYFDHSYLACSTPIVALCVVATSPLVLC